MTCSHELRPGFIVGVIASVYAGLPFLNKFGHDEIKDRSLLTSQDWHFLCEQVERASRPEIITKTGAVLYVEETRAAVMIDIDSAASKLAPGFLSVAVLKF